MPHIPPLASDNAPWLPVQRGERKGGREERRGGRREETGRGREGREGREGIRIGLHIHV